MQLSSLSRNKYIYFVGIGGISMSSLAHILLDRGFRVAGYDRERTELTAMLEGLGAKIYYSTDKAHIENCQAAVYSAAFGNEHPEIVNINAAGIPMYSRADLLGSIAKEYKNSIGVAGTHGKSSTTAMIYSVFNAEKGCSPTVLDGAVITELSSQYKIGSGDTMIFESCEYKDSFLSFFPHIAVVLNVSLDHTDYYHSIQQMTNSFSKFICNSGSDGYAVINLDSPYAMQALNGYTGNVITFSPSGNEDADCFVKECTYERGIAKNLTVSICGKEITGLELSVPGKHSVANALAAVCCAHICRLSEDAVRTGLKSYSGIKRRFEYKGRFCGADVYSDYAHHPDEIKATLSTAKLMQKKRIVTVFQPHTYSRLHDLFDDFAASFGDSDLTVFAETYSAREVNTYGVSPASLCDKIPRSIYLPTFDKIEEYLRQNLCEGDLLIIMGAGNIDLLSKIVEKS